MAPNPPFVDNEIPSSAKWNTGVYVYDVNTTTVDVVSSTTETSIYSKSIGAGHLSTSRLLRVTIEGDALINSGTPTLTLRCKFGATTWFGDVTATISTSAVRQGWWLELYLQNLNATNVQRAWGRAGSSPAVAGSVAGIGNLAANDGSGNPNANWLTVPSVNGYSDFQSNGTTMAEDTTTAKTFDVTVQWDVNSASVSFRKFSAVMELL